MGGSKILLCVGLFLVVSCHCKRLTKLKALDTPRGNSTLSHSRAKGGEGSHGRLLIGPNSLQGAKLKGNQTTENFQDYQADMGWVKIKQPKGDDHDHDDQFSKVKHDDVAVERLLKMEPKVECTGDSMKLKVQDAASTPGSLLFVDRGKELSPLPLSKLPSSCGYTIRSTRKDLVLVAPYDGCFVTLQEDSYVLPLRWWGLPVKMSCPLMRQASSNPPMVTCHAEGMVVKTEWTIPVAKIKVNLNGNWEPLMKASPRCGFSVVVHPEGVVVSISYASCLEIKDGMYTLELAGDGEVKISCPSMSPAQAAPTKGQAKAPKEQTETPGKGVYPANPAPTGAPEPPSKNPAQSAVPLVPGFPENPKLPNKKPNQDIYQPQFPYFPFPLDPYPANPGPKPTPAVQPTPPPVTKNNGQQSHHPVPPARQPLNPWGQVPNPYNQPSEPPQNPIEESWGQKYPQFNQYAFLPQGPYQMPVLPTQQTPTQAPKVKNEQPLSPLLPEVSKPKAPEYLPPSEPPAPESREPADPQGQVPQQFNPYFYYYPKPDNQSPPAEKPTAAPAPPATEKPAGVPQPSEPEAPQGQVPQQFNPYFYYYPKPDEGPPAEKPTAAPAPPATGKPAGVPQPEAPQGQVPQQFDSYFYYYPKPDDQSPPAERPTAAPAPPATEKPAAVPQPSEPEAPQGQVPQQFNPYFYYYPKPGEGAPAEKPTAAPAPPATEKPAGVPQPEAPQGQVPQQFDRYFYYYPKPDDQSPPAERPTAAPAPPATEKPAAVPQPSEPEAPQGQVPQQFNPYFYYYPKPDEGPPAEKPTAAPAPPATEKPAGVPQPEAPQGQVPQQFDRYFYYYPKPDDQSPPAERPTAAPAPPATEKPAAVPQPSEPEAPQGQVPQQFNPYFYYYPKPDEGPPAEKPTAAPAPPATEKPAGVPQPEAPQGQVPQQFDRYFYYYPKPDDQSPPAERPTAAPAPPATEKPAAVPQPSEPEAPQGQVPQQFNPYFYYYPKPDEGPPAEKPTAAPAPPATEKPAGVPQPEAPQGQVPQQFDRYFYYYPKPDDQSPPAERPTAAPAPPATEKPAAVPQPSEPEAPQGQVPQQFNPYFYYYPKPDEGPPAEKPTAAPAPPATEKPAGVPQPSEPEAPQGQVPQQFNPYFYYYPMPDEGPPAERPTAAPAPPATEKPAAVPQPSEPVAPQGQVPQQFNPYFYYYPKPDDQSPPAKKPTAAPAPPATVTLPPATSIQQPPKATTLASSQAPQSGSSYMPPINCPQYCSPGFTNCCPQIAFHQHLHHIVPAGTGSEKLPSIYPGLPFLPSAYSGFDSGIVATAPTLKPTKGASTSTSAPISTHSPPSGNKKQPYNQPPGGNPAVLPGNNPSKPTNPQIYPYFVPNSGYPHQLYQPQNELQNLPQKQTPAHYIVSSNPQAPGYEPVNQMLSNIQPPTQQNNQPSAGDMNQPPGPHFWPLVSQSLRQHIAKRQSRPEGLNSGTQPEPFLSASKKSIRYEQDANPYFEPNSYVLLQHGPPGRESSAFSEIPVPFRNLIHDPNLIAQNLARHQGSQPQHPQTLMPPQEKTQHPKSAANTKEMG